MLRDEIKLRPWRLEDIEGLMQIADDPEIAANLSDMFPSPYTLEAGKRFLKMATTPDVRNVLAIEFKGNLIGGIGIHPQDDILRLNGELGYWIAKPYWGKGIMTLAIDKMISYVFENFDLNRIFARTFKRNKGSQIVLERNHFKLEASFTNTLIKNDVIEDELIFAIRRPGTD